MPLALQGGGGLGVARVFQGDAGFTPHQLAQDAQQLVHAGTDDNLLRLAAHGPVLVKKPGQRLAQAGLPFGIPLAQQLGVVQQAVPQQFGPDLAGEKPGIHPLGGKVKARLPAGGGGF